MGVDSYSGIGSIVESESGIKVARTNSSETDS